MMKTCKKCGAEIPESAAYCDICGAPCSKRLRVREISGSGESAKGKAAGDKAKSAKNRERRRVILRRILLAFGIVFGLLVVFAVVSERISDIRYEKRQQRHDLTGWETMITPEAYEQIDIGMTYEEVRDIVGGEGKKTEEDEYAVTYAWPGEYYMDQYKGLVSVEFRKDRYSDDGTSAPSVDMIEEDSVVNGREIYETDRKIEAQRYSDLDTPVVTKAQVGQLSEGMSYEQVCEIFGGEGELHRSTTWKYETRTTEYKEYVWKCKYGGRDDYFDQRFENGILKDLYEWKADYID